MPEFEFRNNNFDLIRLMAATQVVIIHAWEHFQLPDNVGIQALSCFPGVPVFFVTSGYLVSASLARSNSLVSYFQNRGLRIYPGLWVCFAFSVLTVYLFSTFNCTFPEFALWTSAQLTVAQFYNPDFLRGYGVGALNGSLWTIPVELQFYLALPFLFWLFQKLNWNGWLLAGFVIGLAIFNCFFVTHIRPSDHVIHKLVGVTLLPYLYLFVLGMIFQRYQAMIPKYLQRKFITLLCIYVIITGVSSALGFRYAGNYLNPISAVALALLTLSFAYSYPKWNHVLAGKDISYGVYIYHMIFVNALLQTSPYSPFVNFGLAVILTFLAATLSWVFVEKPCLGLKRYSINVVRKLATRTMT